MADRILSFWLDKHKGGDTMMLPAYYLEADYSVKAVRIHAETAPGDDDALFEIYDDGVSIMEDHDYRYTTYITNTATYSGDTTIHLSKDATEDTMAEDFVLDSEIEAGSWITCYMTQSGGNPKNVTVQLELERLSEGDEDTD